MQNKKSKSLLLHFRVSEREKQILDALCERLGSKPSEFIRSLLRDKFLKVFPKYSEKKDEKPVIEEKELTPEQKCEKLGGSVVTREGVRMCAIKRSPSMMAYTPLTNLE